MFRTLLIFALYPGVVVLGIGLGMAYEWLSEPKLYPCTAEAQAYRNAINGDAYALDPLFNAYANCVLN